MFELQDEVTLLDGGSRGPSGHHTANIRGRFRPSRFFMSFYLSCRRCRLRLFLKRDGAMSFYAKRGGPSIAWGARPACGDNRPVVIAAAGSFERSMGG